MRCYLARRGGDKYDAGRSGAASWTSCSPWWDTPSGSATSGGSPTSASETGEVRMLQSLLSAAPTSTVHLRRSISGALPSDPDIRGGADVHAGGVHRPVPLSGRTRHLSDISDIQGDTSLTPCKHRIFSPNYL